MPIRMKVYHRGPETLVAACDEELLGTTFRERGLRIEVSSFYAGDSVTEDQLLMHLRLATIGNFVGKETVDAVTRGGLRLHVATADLRPGARVSVSIRPHEIAFANTADGRAGDNVLSGRIRRVSYLGDAVDYQVEIEGSDVILRVAAAPALRLRPGETVRLVIPPSACVPLPE